MKKIIAITVVLELITLVLFAGCSMESGGTNSGASFNRNTSFAQTDSSSSVEWREFLKEYEAWVDDYIEITKKYKANPSDMSILSDYTEMMTDMTDWSERAEKMELELKDTAAAMEYSKELLRIAGKLAQVAD